MHLTTDGFSIQHPLTNTVLTNYVYVFILLTNQQFHCRGRFHLHSYASIILNLDINQPKCLINLITPCLSGASPTSSINLSVIFHMSKNIQKIGKKFENLRILQHRECSYYRENRKNLPEKKRK